MAKNANTKKASEKIEVAKVEPEETQPTDMDQATEEMQPTTEDAAADSEEPTYIAPPVAKPVIPDNGYSRLMQFPAEVVLPMYVVVDIGATNRRYQILSDGQEVPKQIIEWMKKDARYMRWFAQ